MMVPVHLFEPGTTGHRPVVARYTVKCLQQLGIPYFMDEAPLDPRLNALAQLDRRAREKGCGITHVLTLEDHLRQFLKDGFLYRKMVPLVGNYYLYTNLKSFFKGAGIRLAMNRAKIERVLVSDEKRDDYRWGLGELSDFIEDPWDPDEFQKLEQREARDILGLDYSRTIFLLFGSLSERKGARLVLEALQCAGFPNHVLVLLAGRPEGEIGARVKEIQQRAGMSLRCDFDFIPEHLVSAYFHAANYVLSAYPAWFQVSSGSFTRACAAGRPSIVGNLGALADRVIKYNCGLTYKAGSAAALGEVLFCTGQAVEKTQYTTWSANAASLGEASRLCHYGGQIVESYQRIPLRN